MSGQQMYAAPSASYAARSPAEMDKLRSRLAKAESEAKVAGNDWTVKTRAEGDVKSLRHELGAAEVELRNAQQRESRQFAAQYEAVNEREPTYMATVPYFRPAKQPKMHVAGKRAARGPATAVAANALAAMKRRDAAAA